MSAKNLLRNLCALSIAIISLNSPLASAEIAAKQVPLVPQSMLLDGKPLTPVTGVTDLKFNELFKLPVGPKGMELTQKALDSAGKKVRMVGYMIKAEPATPGMFVLSPVPEEMGDNDEKLVDDFPANAVFVHLSDAQLAVPHIEGLIKLTGTLQVGNFEESDGHVSTFRLELDPAIVKDLKHALAFTSASK